MEEEVLQAIEFSICGSSPEGEALSLENTDFETLQKILTQLKDIIGEGGKVPICLQTGSIRATCKVAASVAAVVLADVVHYQRGELNEIANEARRKALVSMGNEAKRYGREYAIASNGVEYLRVDKHDYKSKTRARLVDMDTEIEGEVTDAGGLGAQPNIHLKTSRGKCIIAATREQLAEIQGNILYKRILVSVACKYDLVTNTTRDYKLREIVELDDSIDEDVLAEAVSRGAVAWKDVKDPSAWLSELRGE